MNIVLENPSNEGTLRRLKGVGSAVVRRYGRTILEINKSWRRKKRIPQPVLQTRPANGILSRRERLKTWRKNMGLEMDVPSDVILPRDVLETIAEVGPRNDAELEELMKDLPARYHRFGKKILEISLNESE